MNEFDSTRDDEVRGGRPPGQFPAHQEPIVIGDGTEEVQSDEEPTLASDTAMIGSDHEAEAAEDDGPDPAAVAEGVGALATGAAADGGSATEKFYDAATVEAIKEHLGGDNQQATDAPAGETGEADDTQRADNPAGPVDGLPPKSGIVIIDADKTPATKEIAEQLRALGRDVPGEPVVIRPSFDPKATDNPKLDFNLRFDLPGSDAETDRVLKGYVDKALDDILGDIESRYPHGIPPAPSIDDIRDKVADITLHPNTKAFLEEQYRDYLNELLGRKNPAADTGEQVAPPTDKPTELPRVEHEALEATSGSFSTNPKFLIETYERMAVQQPALARAMTLYAMLRSQSPAEAGRMLEVVALTYAAMEAQAETNRLNQMFDRPDEE